MLRLGLRPNQLVEFAFSMSLECWLVTRLMFIDIRAVLRLIKQTDVEYALVYAPILPVSGGFMNSSLDHAAEMELIRQELTLWPARKMKVHLGVLVSRWCSVECNEECCCFF